MVFNEVEINNFRGIKHLLLPDLKQVNLLVGKNNCGKSTVLDAIFLLSGFSNPILNMRINQFRDYNSFTEDDIALNFIICKQAIIFTYVAILMIRLSEN